MPTDSQPTSQPMRQSLWKWLIGILLLAAVIIVVEQQIGWSSALAYWQAVPLTDLLLAFGLFSLSHLIRAYRIYDYVFKTRSTPFAGVIKVSALHQFANNLLPMRLGEAAFPLLLKRYFNITLGKSVSQLLWLRLLDLAVIGLVLAALVAHLISIEWLLAGLGLGILALLIGLSIRSWLFNKMPLIKTMISTLASNAPQGYSTVLRLTAWTLIAWSSKLAAITLIITSLAETGLSQALAGALGAELSGILPIHGIAGAGSYEAAFFAGMALIEKPSAELLAIAVNTHIFVFMSTTIVAMVCLPIIIKPLSKPL